MARRRDDGTRKLRSERLARYAREVDAAVVGGRTPDVQALPAAVGYEDEEQDRDRLTVPPPALETPRGDGVDLGAVPVMLVARKDVAWFSGDRDAERLLDSIDGRSSIEQILRSSGLPRERATSLLLELQASGVIGMS